MDATGDPIRTDPPLSTGPRTNRDYWRGLLSSARRRAWDFAEQAASLENLDSVEPNSRLRRLADLLEELDPSSPKVFAPDPVSRARLRIPGVGAVVRLRGRVLALVEFARATRVAFAELVDTLENLDRRLSRLESLFEKDAGTGPPERPRDSEVTRGGPGRDSPSRSEDVS